VYLVNAGTTVSVRPVTLGVVDGERVAVASGLAAGDVVVTEGGDRLRDGAPIQLPAAAVAADAPAATSPAAARPPGAHRRPRANTSQ
jgi:multidrug efflux system membrane fusion protein